MNKPELALETSASRKIIPARKLKGRVAQTLRAAGKDFTSKPVDAIELTFDGIKGDFHAGATRPSGGREPWYDRGTLMRNERQLSILSLEEMRLIAENLGLPKIEGGWIGANLVLEGIPDLSFLPPRTLLFFEGGATLRIDGYNAPCALAGGGIAQAVGASRKGRIAGRCVRRYRAIANRLDRNRHGDGLQGCRAHEARTGCLGRKRRPDRSWRKRQRADLGAVGLLRSKIIGLPEMRFDLVTKLSRRRL